jgi:hypothetical protein
MIDLKAHPSLAGHFKVCWMLSPSATFWGLVGRQKQMPAESALVLEECASLSFTLPSFSFAAF